MTIASLRHFVKSKPLDRFLWTCALVPTWQPISTGQAEMFQEDGMLRYIAGADGDAPAHDGSFQAGRILKAQKASIFSNWYVRCLDFTWIPNYFPHIYWFHLTACLQIHRFAMTEVQQDVLVSKFKKFVREFACPSGQRQASLLHCTHFRW